MMDSRMIQAKNSEDRLLIETVFRGGQGDVFRYWDELDRESRKKLLDQLRRVDFTLMRKMKNACLRTEKSRKTGRLEPVEIISIPERQAQKDDRERAKSIGEEIIRRGKVAAFLVAGGQGTRLGFDGPKGCYPIGPVTGKSLFQLHAEKILAAVKRYQVRIPWYIMTSQSNDAATRLFFSDNRFFGLPENDICFFTQEMLPVLDESGRFILDEKDHLFMSPNGHGGSLLALMESGAVADMKKRGIELVSYFQVDNVLVKIIDPVFIGYHVGSKAQMSSKMVRKMDPHEKVGVFGKVNGRLKVVEYSDLSESEMTASDQNGELTYGAGSIAIHLINTDFIESEVRGGFKLPYHIARKKIPCLDDSGNRILPDEPNGYKFETFVFDALGDTTRSIVMEVDRSEEFSPVKNHSGTDSPETAKKDMTRYFGRWLESAGIFPSRRADGTIADPIEISPLFAWNEKELAGKLPDEFTMKGPVYLGPET